VVNNATVAAVFVPIMIDLAAADPAFNSVRLVLPLTMATTFGYALPSASGRMALISATGIVESRDMLRYGMLMTVVSSVILIALFYLLGVANLI
jgi:sodium-dependent dicarboxylate transporter 2/3/5